YLYTSDTESSLRLFEYLYTYINRTDERYPVLLRNMAIAYLNEDKWDQALNCLASIPSGKEPEKAAMDKLIAMYIYIHTGQKEELNSTRIELGELLPQISNLNIQQSFYLIDSEYHMHEGDLKNALIQLKRTLIYKDQIQAHLSKGTPDELYATYQIDKLKTKYSRLEHSIILFVSIFFFATLLICSFYIWYRRKKRLYIFELESKLEALESIVEKDRSTSSAIADTIIRDLEITKRIALLKNQQINTNQTFVEKLNKVLTIDDKNPFTIEWPRFYDDVDKLYNGFYKYLCDSYSSLSEKELQLCCLMRVGFKTDEIAAVWAQSIYSVQKCRSSVRKKMQTSEGADIILFIEDKMKTS
ncbi:MAG: helix-turn-helix transcriptional regulator, partial [Bacteroidales bacterium]